MLWNTAKRTLLLAGAVMGACGGQTEDGGSELGLACQSNADCPSLECWAPSVGRPAPAGGMCTLSCANDPTICEAIEPGAHCEAFGDLHYCVAACQEGPEGLASLDPNKCHGRSDLACVAWEHDPPVCLPSCNFDSDCPPGMACDGKTRLCQKPSGLLPYGAACDGDSECNGYCLPFSNGHKACVEACTLGVAGCEWGEDGLGFCTNLTGWRVGLSIGDLGYCSRLCDCDTSCGSADFYCGDPQDPTWSRRFGMPGVCFPVTFNIALPLACSDAAP